MLDITKIKRIREGGNGGGAKKKRERERKKEREGKKREKRNKWPNKQINIKDKVAMSVTVYLHNMCM